MFPKSKEMKNSQKQTEWIVNHTVPVQCPVCHHEVRIPVAEQGKIHCFACWMKGTLSLLQPKPPVEKKPPERKNSKVSTYHLSNETTR